MAQIDDSLRGSTRYQYDASQRLTQVQGPNPEVFIHDPAGNLLADSPATPQGQQAPGNRLNLFGDAHFSYDAYGNRSQQARGKQGALKTHYQYNALNQLTAIAVNGVITQYTYDPLGRRISKRSADKCCEFLWLGDQLLAEKLIDPTGAQLSAKTYLFKPNSFEPIAFVQNDGIYYYHLDHLGTPQEITNQQGELVWAVSYKAYGNLAVAFKAEVENNLRFAGQYFDEESGLHYNRFRYYDPVCGRFINQDPIGLLGGVNNYLYVPNPTGWVDPLGLAAKPGDCPSIPPRATPRIEDGNSKEGWIHIDQRHVTGNSAQGPGDLFAKGTTRAQIDAATKKVVLKGTRISDPKYRMQTYEKRIKVNGKVDRVRVTVDSHDHNRVITAFPVRSE